MAPRVTSGSSRASASSAMARAAALRSADAERLRRYAAYLDFYNGKQWAKPRPGQTNLVVNYARTIVDKAVSYLLGGGVGLEILGDGRWEIGDGKAPRGEEGESRRGGEGESEGVRDSGLSTQHPGLHSSLITHHPSLLPAEELLHWVYEDNDLEAVDAQGAINGAALGDTVFKVYWEKGIGDRRWGDRR